jgi:hypothetical protein
MGLRPRAAELPGFHAEELRDPCPPLVGERLAVHQHKGGDLAGGDDRAGHHCFPRRGRRYQHDQVMPGQFGHRCALDAGERGGERELLLRARGTLVGDVQAAAGLVGEAGEGVEHAAGQDEAAVDGLLEAVQERRDVVVEARIRCRSFPVRSAARLSSAGVIRPRSAIASRSSPVPRRRASSAGMGAVKNTHACAPTPDRETSRATGTCRARPALTYMRASNIASGPSKSAASHQHLSPSSSGYKPMWASPFKCAASTAAVSGG